MTVSLRTRLLGVLERANRKYAGHRTLEAVTATVETLLRLRGDIDDSAVRVADLDPVLKEFLQFHLDTSTHVAAEVAVPGGGTSGQYLRKASGADYDVVWSNVSWGDITGTPPVFTVAPHSHTKAEITDFAHGHTVGEIQNLSEILMTKASLSGASFYGSVSVSDGNITIDRVGDAADARLNLQADAALDTSIRFLHDEGSGAVRRARLSFVGASEWLAAYLSNTSGTSEELAWRATRDGAFEAAYNGTVKVATDATGATVSGTVAEKLQYAGVAEAGTATIDADTRRMIIEKTGGGIDFTALTLAFPTTPKDGHVVTVLIRGNVTTLTITIGGGHSMLNGPAAWVADTSCCWVFRSTNTTWYREQIV